MSVLAGIDFIQNGEDVDEVVLNRPTQELGANIDATLNNYAQREETISIAEESSIVFAIALG